MDSRSWASLRGHSGKCLESAGVASPGPGTDLEMEQDTLGYADLQGVRRGPSCHFALAGLYIRKADEFCMPYNTLLLGVEFSVPKMYVEVLTPNTAQCATFGNSVFTEETKLQ